jgi:uncharacterized protein with NAD-binding domain and iron-sulfur cluster
LGKSRHSVVVIGGGVAGLSAAHELAERGFEVHVYERRCYYGGKAASVTIGRENPQLDGANGPKGFPGEHGFRFFPGWYRHLPDLMKRIPYKDRTVHDNLVPADVNLLVAYDRDPLRAIIRLPTTLAELSTIASLPSELMRLGLTMDDLQFFFGKLWKFLTSSEERRLQEFDNQTWWEFMEADTRSQEFRDYLVVSATRNTVAAKPTEASAYTIAKIALQTLFDTLNPQTFVDRVLNGPTNVVWIDPWKEYLAGLGVRFHDDHELESIELDDHHISCVRFAQTLRLRHARRLTEYYALCHERWEAIRCGVEGLRGREDAATWERHAPALRGWLQPELGFALDPEGQRPEEREQYGEVERRLGELVEARAAWRACEAALDALRDAGTSPPASKRETFLASVRATLERIQERWRAIAQVQLTLEQERSRPVAADHFVFALPVEQMAYYISRSDTLQEYDPSLRNILRLSEHVDWMAGIQFYLRNVVNITRGHIDLLDSEWALTAVSAVQFWKDSEYRLPESEPVRSILSVDISAWDRKGRFNRKEAYNCDRREIAREVWAQLKTALNRPGKTPVLSDEMLLGAAPDDPRSFYLDDSIIDHFDRKKQAIYDKFRSVRFSAAELIRKQSHRGAPSPTSFVYGQPLQFNAEPLLVNRVGSLRLRPRAKTAISNMFLAADYIRTNSHLATMESANEAARAAVNEIILASGVKEKPCEIWPLSEPFELFRKIDEGLFRRGQQFEDTYADIPVRMVAGAANVASRMAAKAVGKLLARAK